MLLSRYNSLETVLALEIDIVFDLIKKAQEKEREGRIWEEYLSIRPNMSKENYMSYSEYKEHYEKPQVQSSGRSRNEIVERAKRIAANDRKGA